MVVSKNSINRSNYIFIEDKQPFLYNFQEIEIEKVCQIVCQSLWSSICLYGKGEIFIFFLVST